MCVSVSVPHHAGEVPLHQPLSKELCLQPCDKGHEVINSQSPGDGLILLDDRPAAVLQDQQTHVSAEIEHRMCVRWTETTGYHTQ